MYYCVSFNDILQTKIRNIKVSLIPDLSRDDVTFFLIGVTTVVDGGSSGAMTFEGLRKFVVDKNETRVLVRLTKLLFMLISCSRGPP